MQFMDAIGCGNSHCSIPVSPFRSTSSVPWKPGRSLPSRFRANGMCPSNNQLDRRIQLRPLTYEILPTAARCRSVVRRNAAIRCEVTASADYADHSCSPSNTQKGFQLSLRARGACFYAVTAVVAIPLFITMVLVHPCVLLFDRYRRAAHHLIAKVWASLAIAPFYKVEYEGLENLPSWSSPAVYVSNHQSFLDIYTLLTLGRGFKFISKRAIFLFPIIGWAMYLMGLIPLRRMDNRSQLECLKRCMTLVKQGASVFFFPEGTRSKDGKLGVFKKGAFSVAAKMGVPVVPITLLGTGKLMPANMEGFLDWGPVKVVIHKPIQGGDADALCKESRSIIANTLLTHGL